MLNTVPDTAEPKVNKEITIGEGWEVMQKAGIWTSTTSATLGVSTEVVEASNRRLKGLEEAWRRD